MKIDQGLICRAQTSAGHNVHKVAGLIALYRSFAEKGGQYNRIARDFERELRRVVAVGSRTA